MASIQLLIEELRSPGIGLVNDAARFAFTIEEHASHRGPLELPIKLRTTRIDYPGNDVPTEQVMGWNYEPITFQGSWEDRHMGAGVALDTMRAFRGLVKRGSLVRVSLEQVTFKGVITDFRPSYEYEAKIGWEFTFSPHADEGIDGAFARVKSRRRLPKTALRTPDDYNRRLAGPLDLAYSYHQRGPKVQINSSLWLDIGTSLDAAISISAAINVTVRDRVPSRTDTADVNRRLAAQFASAHAAAADTVELLYDLSTDDHLSWSSATGELEYEIWVRGVQQNARQAMLRAYEAKLEMARRADPSIIAIYQPGTGESLYAIALRFYGDPAMWRIIQERNNLEYINLLGTETLEIPEARV